MRLLPMLSARNLNKLKKLPTMAERACRKTSTSTRTENSRKRRNQSRADSNEPNKGCNANKAEPAAKVKKSSREETDPAVLNDKELLRRYTLRKEHLKRGNVVCTSQVFRKLCDSLEKARNSKKAEEMSKYMRFQFDFFGIQSPERREISKPLWKEVHLMNSSDLRTLVCESWYSPEREFQYFAVDLFEREYLRIYSDDGLSPENYATSTLDFVRQFLASTNSWWDTVDSLATKVVGPLVKKYPEYLLPVMDKWNVSEVTWLVRTSIIYQLKYGQETDVERLYRYCLKVAHEDEFFIQKAIGWALRQHCRVDEQSVKKFVGKNKKILSALSIREALKNVK